MAQLWHNVDDLKPLSSAQLSLLSFMWNFWQPTQTHVLWAFQAQHTLTWTSKPSLLVVFSFQSNGLTIYLSQKQCHIWHLPLFNLLCLVSYLLSLSLYPEYLKMSWSFLISTAPWFKPTYLLFELLKLWWELIRLNSS